MSTDCVLERSIPEPNTGCWLFAKSLKNNGYGQLWWNGKRRDAHRWAWTMARGEIPAGLHVLHSCDVRSCVNPDHLFLGTNRDNIRDMVAKGRNSRGAAHTNAKLTDEIVREIRSSSESSYILARRFGVSRAAIIKVRRRKTWAHVR